MYKCFEYQSDEHLEMKKLSHIYRQSFVHERQSLDKTITSLERQIQSKYDNLGLGKTTQGKVRQF